MDMASTLSPYPKGFPELLEEYCRNMQEAQSRNWHHDQRRAVFLDFYRKGFGVEPIEVELEHKVKVAQVRGYIDALFDVTILEFKSDMERERAAGLSELHLYLKSRKNPDDYVSVLTDGELFEVYQYGAERVELIDSFKLRPDDPLNVFLKLDQFRTRARLRRPTSDDIVIRFGPHSLVYRKALALMQGLYSAVHKESAVATKFREWNRLLAKVYGAELGYSDLFLTHTYLVVLSRLMVAQALFPKEKRDSAMYRGIMTGEYFLKKKLPNLAEPDFFSWALNTETEAHFIGLIGRMEQYVGTYDFGSTEEDILKELYQNLVDPADRHDLGEYYTPDWLAELTLERIGYSGGSLLDPSCGSGTFLMCAIRRLREAGLKKGELVEAVTRDIAGIDVHPVAVLMAKANILLAIGADARKYKGQIRLPIFMADTLQTELDESRGYLKIPAAKGCIFHIPLKSIDQHVEHLDDLIEEMQRFAHTIAEGGVDADAAKSGFIKKFPFLESDKNGESLFWRHNLDTAARLIKQKRNSIWAFILKNSYRPTFLRKQKVDFIVGNPPWLSYRYIRDDEYKERVRELCFEYGLLEPSNRALITQIELATVFYRHCQKHFLKDGGRIGMVLPWGAMGGAKQHEKFQQQGGFTHAMDFHEVTGLFNVPCCVMIAGANEGKYPVKCERFKGILNAKNPRWKTIKNSLLRHEEPLKFITHQTRSSWYRDIALQGATIVPRSLFFIERDPTSADYEDAPYVQTSHETIEDAKKPWDSTDVRLTGQIEKKYIFYTLLAKGLVPFGIKRAEMIFLPISQGRGGRIEILTANELIAKGDRNASVWLLKSEKIWEKHSKDNKYTLLQWLNYSQKLTKQNLKTKYMVLYNKSGSNLTAVVHQQGQFRKNGDLIINGLIADYTTYRIELDTLAHADYLCAILNSENVMEAIKETMTKGLLGERDITRRPFEVCEIPLFNSQNDLHNQIATLGEICRLKAAKVAGSMEGAIGRARLEMREYLAVELHELNNLVTRLLKEPPDKKKRATFVREDEEPTLF